MTVPRRRARRIAATLALLGLVLVALGWARISGSDGAGHDDEPAGVPTAGHAVPAAPAEVPPEVGGARAEPPVAVRIPALGVSAPVVPVTAVAGVLTPPADVRLVGWWRDGAVPGSVRGTVLLTGHTYSAGDGVFDDLGRLRAGDLVRVLTPGGRIDYRVEDVAVHERAQIRELAAGLFSRRSAPRLVLTTCSGYDGSTYRTTTVVVAAPASAGRRADPGS